MNTRTDRVGAMGGDLSLWFDGEQSRPLQLCRPCACECDTRNGEHVGWAGYLTVSDVYGCGLTFWLKTEAEFQRVQDMLRASGRSNKTHQTKSTT
mgnify:CR=1 FL=1